MNLFNSSCAQDNKWFQLKEKINKTFKICEPCVDRYDEKDVRILLDILNKDLGTNKLDSLKYKRQYAFSFCENKYKEKGYLDCFYITELKASDAEEAENIYKELEKIPNTTIYYVRPQFWHWILRGDTIYFLYSNVYGFDSYEFEEIKAIMYKIL